MQLLVGDLSRLAPELPIFWFQPTLVRQSVQSLLPTLIVHAVFLVKRFHRGDLQDATRVGMRVYRIFKRGATRWR